MSSFLFIISFLLHIILLITVYYLFQQIQRLKKDQADEITELFEFYLREIRSENRRLESEIEYHHFDNHQHEQQNNKIDKRPESMITYEPSNLDTDLVHDKYETSLEAQILQLYDQGMEVAEIAQKLNCGKTEAALMINLSKKKNQKP